MSPIDFSGPQYLKLLNEFYRKIALAFLLTAA